MRGNCVDDTPEPIFAALQSRVEIAQAPGAIIEDLPEVSEFIFPAERHLMLKFARANALEPSTNRASGWVMLRVITRPR